VPVQSVLFRAFLLPTDAVFALELEKMMGQIQDAADSVLDNPDGAPALIAKDLVAALKKLRTGV